MFTETLISRFLLPSLDVVKENQWTVAPNICLWDLVNNFSCSFPISTITDRGKLVEELRNNSELHRKKKRNAIRLYNMGCLCSGIHKSYLRRRTFLQGTTKLHKVISTLIDMLSLFMSMYILNKNVMNYELTWPLWISILLCIKLNILNVNFSLKFCLDFLLRWDSFFRLGTLNSKCVLQNTYFWNIMWIAAGLYSTLVT